MGEPPTTEPVAVTSHRAPTWNRGSVARFRYCANTSPSFRITFPARIDIRVALLLPKRLGAPASVERALRRSRCRHVRSERGRCAAFALGSARREGDRRCWYIVTLQSDLASMRSSALRDYLRGWRTALFVVLIDAARKAGVDEVYVSPAREVFRASLLARRPGTALPSHWTTIYDSTAQAFGMRLACIERPINIQMLPRRRACWSTEFFALHLTPRADA